MPTETQLDFYASGPGWEVRTGGDSCGGNCKGNGSSNGSTPSSGSGFSDAYLDRSTWCAPSSGSLLQDVEQEADPRGRTWAGWGMRGLALLGGLGVVRMGWRAVRLGVVG